MNRWLAQLVMGYFKTGNARMIRSAAKFLDMHPERMLKQAHSIIGNKRAITGYKNLHGVKRPLGSPPFNEGPVQKTRRIHKDLVTE